MIADALRRDWPGIKAQAPDGGGSESAVRDVSWSYAENGRELEGYSHPDGTCIYLDGPIDLVVKFVAWYRKLIPADVDVVFCDDGYNFSGAVTADTSETDLVAIAEG